MPAVGALRAVADARRAAPAPQTTPSTSRSPSSAAARPPGCTGSWSAIRGSARAPARRPSRSPGATRSASRSPAPSTESTSPRSRPPWSTRSARLCDEGPTADEVQRAHVQFERAWLSRVRPHRGPRRPVQRPRHAVRRPGPRQPPHRRLHQHRRGRRHRRRPHLAAPRAARRPRVPPGPRRKPEPGDHAPRPAVVPPQPWAFPPARTAQLDNGLTVRLHHLPGQHVVSAALLMDVPLSSEPADREGVAGVSRPPRSTEGTQTHPGTSFAEAVEDCGAVIEASVGYSPRPGAPRRARDHLRRPMRLLAEPVRSPPTLADADVDRHRRLRGWPSSSSSWPPAPVRANHALRARADRSALPRVPGRTAMPEALTAITGAGRPRLPRVHPRPARHRPGHRRRLRRRRAGRGRRGVRHVAQSRPGAPAPRDAHRPPPPRSSDRPARLGAGRPALGMVHHRPPRPALARRCSWPPTRSAAPTSAASTACCGRRRGSATASASSTCRCAAGGFTYAHGSFRTEVVGEALSLMPGLLDVRRSPITDAELTRAADYPPAAAATPPPTG